MGFFGVSGPVRCWICDGVFFRLLFFPFRGDLAGETGAGGGASGGRSGARAGFRVYSVDVGRCGVCGRGVESGLGAAGREGSWRSGGVVGLL